MEIPAKEYFRWKKKHKEDLEKNMEKLKYSSFMRHVLKTGKIIY